MFNSITSETPNPTPRSVCLTTQHTLTEDRILFAGQAGGGGVWMFSQWAGIAWQMCLSLPPFQSHTHHLFLITWKFAAVTSMTCFSLCFYNDAQSCDWLKEINVQCACIFFCVYWTVNKTSWHQNAPVWLTEQILFSIRDFTFVTSSFVDEWIVKRQIISDSCLDSCDSLIFLLCNLCDLHIFGGLDILSYADI